MAIVDYQQHGQVVTITMNRPERLNAFGLQMRHELSRAWQRFLADPQARVAVLTGAGRMFCAGRDIKEQAERGGLTAAASPTPQVLGFFLVPDTVKPIIAAV